MIIDAHVRLGPGRSAELAVAELAETMDRLGIDRAMIAAGEYATAWDNRGGNDEVTAAAAASDGRLVAYAVANPWARADAVAELARARDLGARALAVDPALQGFDLLDGLVDPLLAFAQESGWLVYVRTGTPPHAVPLPLASLARRWPALTFVMGRSGATDFWIDAAPALRHAPNLYADTSYAPWDTVLSEFARDPEIGAGRLVFSTDAPYTVPSAELARITDWPIPDGDRAAVLGGTLARLLG
ncbi:amidohydrolase family protein [Jiangella mangrovi]|uniref:Putative TIM-barrel fold metal-dependent hydrolase n=1 Tax=Jiangella mangrovi TaxID=1524084 RepID=A0A7W9GVY9_9ACTN|nr:amidohydrolase family protein [Jiangella mangrovi]MBB5790671.1 putative TIM-barrel fold metal-dependent hydrolase [Jiangella mangrovi]